MPRNNAEKKREMDFEPEPINILVVMVYDDDQHHDEVDRYLENIDHIWYGTGIIMRILDGDLIEIWETKKCDT